MVSCFGASSVSLFTLLTLCNGNVILDFIRNIQTSMSLHPQHPDLYVVSEYRSDDINTQDISNLRDLVHNRPAL